MSKIVFVLALALLLMGCQSEPQAPTTDAEPETVPVERVSEQRVVRERRTAQPTPPDEGLSNLVDPAREMPRLQGELNRDGFGLTMLLDGSSPEAFGQSLELIASDTSPQQYQSLNSALRYLRTATLGPRNLAEFYQTLDSMSGEEVIEMARQRQAERRRG